LTFFTAYGKICLYLTFKEIAMAFQKSVPVVTVDVDAAIRQMLIDKKSVRDICKVLHVSNTKVCKIRKMLVSGDTIQKPSKTAPVTKRNDNAIQESNAYTPEEVESKRKAVEMLALQAMEDRLNEGDVTIKDATSVLSVVGEKPKQQGDTVVMLINSVGNMAVAARQLLINEAKAKQIPAPDVVDVKPDDNVSDS